MILGLILQEEGVRLKKGSILRTMAAILIICFLVPFLFQIFQVNITVNNLVEDKVTNAAQKTLENSALYISGILQNQFDTANYFKDDYKVVSAVSHMDEADEAEKFNMKESIAAKLRYENNFPEYKYPYYFMLLDYKGNMMTDYTYTPYGDYIALYQELSAEPWFSVLADSYSDKTIMFSGQDFLNQMGTNKFYVATNVNAEGNEGILIIATDEASIASQFYDVLTEGSSFIVTPDGECIVEFSDGKIDYTDALAEQLSWETDELLVEGEDYTVLEAPVVVKGYDEIWDFFSIVSTDDLKEDVRRVSRINNVVLFLYLLAIVWVIWLLNRIIVKPIRQMQAVVNQVRDGRLDACVEQRWNNELGDLGEGINVMTRHLQKYFEDMKAREEEKRITEFRMLQSQIKPHFVRNVLNTIRWLAEINGIASVSRSVMALSNLLEYNFKDSSLITTVREELDYVETYLYLQKMRFQNKFRDEIHVEEDLMDKPILKLSFQPIVENCIYHGVMNKEGLGTIRIVGKKNGGTMEISISDDGAGMEQSQAEQILKPPEKEDFPAADEKTENIAIWNVNQRLKRKYGEEYGLKIYSFPGKGTRVVISVPLEEEDNLDKNTDH